MTIKAALPLLLLLGLPVSAAQEAPASPSSDGTVETEATEQESAKEPAGFPEDMWGVYGRNNHACRYRGMAVAGKIGIRADKIIVEGEPYDLYEVHEQSNRHLIGEFVAPGGWSTSGVRMSFQLLRKNKIWHRTFNGRAGGKIGYVRCRNRR